MCLILGIARLGHERRRLAHPVLGDKLPFGMIARLRLGIDQRRKQKTFALPLLRIRLGEVLGRLD